LGNPKFFSPQVRSSFLLIQLKETL